MKLAGCLSSLRPAKQKHLSLEFAALWRPRRQTQAELVASGLSILQPQVLRRFEHIFPGKDTSVFLDRGSLSRAKI